MTLVFLDTETTGLDPARHEVWEIAYAVDEGPVLSAVVPHDLGGADPKALRLNGYLDRIQGSRHVPYYERRLISTLKGATVVGANPAFDTDFLRRRWGRAPWKHRLIDVEAMAYGILRLDEPVGLARLADMLGVQQPDHTAATDVLVLRDVYARLRLHAASLAPIA